MGDQVIFNILGTAFLMIAAYISFKVTKKKNDLGPMQLGTLGGFKYVDKLQLTILVICAFLWGYSVTSEALYEFWGDGFGYMFLGGMVLLMMVIIQQMMIKPGLYKAGLATGTAIIFYSEIRSYEVIEDKRDSDIIYIYFNGGNKFFNSKRIVAEKKNLVEIKKILKKSCSFKN